MLIHIGWGNRLMQVLIPTQAFFKGNIFVVTLTFFVHFPVMLSPVFNISFSFSFSRL